MQAEDIINLKGFPVISGCTVTTWNKLQLLKPEEYRNQMKHLANLIKVNEQDLPDGGLAGDIKWATNHHSAMYLSEQADDKNVRWLVCVGNCYYSPNKRETRPTG